MKIIIGVILVIYLFRVSAQRCISCGTGCCCNDCGAIKSTNEVQKPGLFTPSIPAEQADQFKYNFGYAQSVPMQYYPYAAYPSGAQVSYQTSTSKNSPRISTFQPNEETENDCFGYLRNILFKKLDAASK